MSVAQRQDAVTDFKNNPNVCASRFPRGLDNLSCPATANGQS